MILFLRLVISIFWKITLSCVLRLIYFEKRSNFKKDEEMIKMEPNEITIFFMPHCEKELYIHVLEKNFNDRHNFCLIGNPIQSYISIFELMNKFDDEVYKKLKVISLLKSNI